MQDEPKIWKTCEVNAKFTHQQTLMHMYVVPRCVQLVVTWNVDDIGYSWQYCTICTVLIAVMLCYYLQVMAAVGQQQNSNCEGN